MTLRWLLGAEARLNLLAGADQDVAEVLPGVIHHSAFLHRSDRTGISRDPCVLRQLLGEVSVGSAGIAARRVRELVQN
jgi:hypothetical protein